MRGWIAALVVCMAVCAQASDGGHSNGGAGTLCSDAWYRFIEDAVSTGDSRGHGPDVGSDEWKSVVEFKLGLRDAPDLPDRDSEAWCRRIDGIVRAGVPGESNHDGKTDATIMGGGPSFDCSGAAPGSIEEMICEDDGLSALDRELSMVYAAAAHHAAGTRPPVLRAEQRGWIKARDACWKADDTRACVQDAYQRRIAELQAQYGLVQGKGPFRFICDQNAAQPVMVTFFPTDPPTLIAERDDEVALMTLQPSGSGAKYQGRNETFWEHHGEASITWGVGAPPMRCTKVP